MKREKKTQHVKKISVRQSDLAEVTGGSNADSGAECGSESAAECGSECAAECAPECGSGM